MHAKSSHEGQKQYAAHRVVGLRAIHRKAAAAWPESIEELDEEYPETPWFSVGSEEMQLVVELTDVYRIRTFEGYHLAATDDVEVLWSTLIRLMAIQGFGIRGIE